MRFAGEWDGDCAHCVELGNDHCRWVDRLVVLLWVYLLHLPWLDQVQDMSENLSKRSQQDLILVDKYVAVSRCRLPNTACRLASSSNAGSYVLTPGDIDITATAIPAEADLEWADLSLDVLLSTRLFWYRPLANRISPNWISRRPWKKTKSSCGAASTRLPATSSWQRLHQQTWLLRVSQWSMWRCYVAQQWAMSLSALKWQDWALKAQSTWLGLVGWKPISWCFKKQPVCVNLSGLSG